MRCSILRSTAMKWPGKPETLTIILSRITSLIAVRIQISILNINSRKIGRPDILEVCEKMENLRAVVVRASAPENFGQDREKVLNASKITLGDCRSQFYHI